MKYVLGLDIGITSVGWAVLNLDDKRLEALGVRAFNVAEEAKTGAPLAKPRRLARTAARRLRRRAGRLRRTKNLFAKYQLVPSEAVETTLAAAGAEKTPWELRLEGLDRKLTGEEFARALFHIVKRRGFKSNRKAERAKEVGKMQTGVDSNRAILEEHHYRTAGEMYAKHEKFRLRKKNTTDSYLNTIARDLLEQEIKTLFECQRALGSGCASAQFEEELLEVFRWQKPFASGDDILKMVGPCTFEPNELRAPINSYHYERFKLFEKINHLNIFTNSGTKYLDDSERQILHDLAYKNNKVTFKQVRAALKLSDDARFGGLKYLVRPKKGEPKEESMKCESKTFVELKGYHAIKSACKLGVWESVKDDPDLMDHIAYAATFYKTDEDIESYLSAQGVDEAVIVAAQECDFSRVGHLSLVAVKKILPYLEEGKVYSDACSAAGYEHTGNTSEQKHFKLPPEVVGGAFTNPVARRALAQSRKVINAVISRYGSPYRIHVELARDMRRTAEKRKEIRNEQEENRKCNEELAKEFKRTFGHEPKAQDVRKLKLYHEQQCKCAYTQTPLELNRLCEQGYVEIDHIVPYSRCFNDGLSNQVLVLSSANQNKGKRTPFEMFGGDEKRWHAFEKWVKATIRNSAKCRNLLIQELDENEWKDRSLNDTSYIAREFTSIIRNNLLFADPDVRQPLVCTNGQVVARVRRRWGLHKDREENDLHHAVDAAVIAALLPHQIQLITKHAQVVETRERYVDTETGEILEYEHNKPPRLPQPWKGFRNEVLDKVENVVVSRMPKRKATGPMHDATTRSAKLLGRGDEPISTVRVKLKELKASSLRKLVDPENNVMLYEALKKRMEDFGGNAEKAFAEPFYKPRKDGTEEQGHPMRSVKVYQTQYSGIRVRQGIADNSTMIRVDIFRKQNKKRKWEYYATPVYVADRMMGKLPDRLVVGRKPPEEWLPIDDSYEFMFSLHSFDLVRITKASETILGYYRDFDRNRISITLCAVNKADDKHRICIKTVDLIEKLEMDVLGEYYPVRREVRRGLADNSDNEPGDADG